MQKGSKNDIAAFPNFCSVKLINSPYEFDDPDVMMAVDKVTTESLGCFWSITPEIYAGMLFDKIAKILGK